MTSPDTAYTSNLRRKMDHDVRSIMNVVLGYCSFLTEQADADPALNEIAGDLHSIRMTSVELLRLNHQIDQLYTISRREWHADAGVINLAALLQEVIDDLRGRYSESSIVIYGDALVSTRDTMAARSLLESVLTNLAASLMKDVDIVATIRAGSQPSVEFAPARELTSSESRRVQTALEMLESETPDLDNIRKFESHYTTVMKHLTGASVTVDVVHHLCDIRLGEHAEDL